MTALNADRQDSLATGFTYISERTLYTRYGNWFVALCAVIVAMGLVAERML
jgi:apolipoprotein N-acyltransferase